MAMRNVWPCGKKDEVKDMLKAVLGAAALLLLNVCCCGLAMRNAARR